MWIPCSILLGIFFFKSEIHSFFTSSKIFFCLLSPSESPNRKILSLFFLFPLYLSSIIIIICLSILVNERYYTWRFFFFVSPSTFHWRPNILIWLLKLCIACPKMYRLSRHRLWKLLLSRIDYPLHLHCLFISI